jgi:N-acetylglucosaminyldiphosphoundecaprenol N-acetyl-beta-D-mannosaminyltransferase
VADSSVIERRQSASRSVWLGGQRVDLFEEEQVLHAVGDAFDGARRPLRIMSANLDHIYRFDGEADLFESADDAQWIVLLDGMPLVWATQVRTHRRWPKLAGSDLLPSLLDVCVERNARVGFLGGGDELRERLPVALAECWPDLQVAGHWTPPRAVLDDPEASDELADEMHAAGVDLLAVGLNKPHQEHWVARHGARTGASVTTGFGAAADFLAGIKERCPEPLSRVGAEWAYRLYKEPRRLARRYLAEGPVALGRVMTRR